MACFQGYKMHLGLSLKKGQSCQYSTIFHQNYVTKNFIWGKNFEEKTVHTNTEGGTCFLNNAEKRSVKSLGPYDV